MKKKKKKNVPVNIMTMSIGGISIAGLRTLAATLEII